MHIMCSTTMNIDTKKRGQPSNLRNAAYKDALLKDIQQTSASLSSSKDAAQKFLAKTASDGEYESKAAAAWAWIT